MSLDPIALSAILILLLVAAVVLWFLYRSRRTSGLRERFGDSEYNRTFKRHGRRGKAEANLMEREKRVAALKLRPFDAAERARYSADWQRARARFIDDPAASISDADQVIGEVMAAQGYPVADFDARFETLSVDHPSIARNYSRGHDIARKQLEGQATTEELRQAMIHYETLFDELVSEPQKEPGPTVGSNPHERPGS